MLNNQKIKKFSLVFFLIKKLKKKLNLKLFYYIFTSTHLIIKYSLKFLALMWNRIYEKIQHRLRLKRPKFDMYAKNIYIHYSYIYAYRINFLPLMVEYFVYLIDRMRAMYIENKEKKSYFSKTKKAVYGNALILYSSIHRAFSRVIHEYLQRKSTFVPYVGMSDEDIEYIWVEKIKFIGEGHVKDKVAYHSLLSTLKYDLHWCYYLNVIMFHHNFGIAQSNYYHLSTHLITSHKWFYGPRKYNKIFPGYDKDDQIEFDQYHGYYLNEFDLFYSGKSVLNCMSISFFLSQDASPLLTVDELQQIFLSLLALNQTTKRFLKWFTNYFIHKMFLIDYIMSNELSVRNKYCFQYKHILKFNLTFFKVILTNKLEYYMNKKFTPSIIRSYFLLRSNRIYLNLMAWKRANIIYRVYYKDFLPSRDAYKYRYGKFARYLTVRWYTKYRYKLLSNLKYNYKNCILYFNNNKLNLSFYNTVISRKDRFDPLVSFRTAFAIIRKTRLNNYFKIQQKYFSVPSDRVILNTYRYKYEYGTVLKKYLKLKWERKKDEIKELQLEYLLKLRKTKIINLDNYKKSKAKQVQLKYKNFKTKVAKSYFFHDISPYVQLFHNFRYVTREYIHRRERRIKWKKLRYRIYINDYRSEEIRRLTFNEPIRVKHLELEAATAEIQKEIDDRIRQEKEFRSWR